MKVITLEVIFYGFKWSIFSCPSSCLLLKHLKHLGLPIMNKNLFKGQYVCVCLSMQYFGLMVW